QRVGVVLQDELLDDVAERPLGLVGQVERLTVRQDAVADLEDLRVGVAALHRNGHGVERADRRVGHALALEQRAHRVQPVALRRPGSGPWQERNWKIFESTSIVPRVFLALEYGPKYRRWRRWRSRVK